MVGHLVNNKKQLLFAQSSEQNITTAIPITIDLVPARHRLAFERLAAKRTPNMTTLGARLGCVRLVDNKNLASSLLALVDQTLLEFIMAPL